LVLPATDAPSERVFSSLKRIKTYLRNSMSQARLNHLMNIHKEETDQMSLAEVAKLPQRREDFGINKFM
jgi:16S rRNA U1498 N3-methylase RsmE